MAGILPNQGENHVLNSLFKAGITRTLHLYTNNITPAETDTPATFTEASGFGYASVSLVDADWTITSPTASCAKKTFTFTGALGDVYGSYVTNPDNTLFVSERYATKITISYNGSTIDVTVNFNLLEEV